MILLIDNYDSFSYNLYQYLGELADEIKVIRNDAMTVPEIAALHPTHIILSPGPGRPEDAGIIIETVRQLGSTVPILGVCLGEQAVCAAYGASIIHAKKLMHGKQSEVTLSADCPLFRGLPARTAVARYHSLAEDAEYTECAEFLGSFHSPKEDGEYAWEPDTEYEDYQWWLAKNKDGGWDIVSFGY